MSLAVDNDGDSQMQSSIAASSPQTDSIDKPTTPVAQTGFSQLSELSPPNSQGGPIPQASINPSAPRGANVNGKRPLSTVDNNGDRMPVLPGNRTGESLQKESEGPKVHTHALSGYTWSRQEDEPGWSWKNKRAVEEANRAWESLVLKDKRVGNQYGDPFEMADRELALRRSRQLS